MRYSIPFAAFLLLTLVHTGCVEESDDLIREKLEIILQDDLESLTGQIPKQSVADSVYFIVQSYESFEEGKYSKKAVVEFFFLRNDIAKVVRKYRYQAEYRKWERYFNQYKYVYDTSETQ